MFIIPPRTSLLKTSGAALLVAAAVSLIVLSRNQIVIKTVPVTELHPHTHNAGDSVDMAGHHEVVLSTPIELTEDTWITDITFKVHNAPDVVLHHAWLVNTNYKFDRCASTDGYLLSGAGQDTLYKPRISFPSGYALFVPKGSRVMLEATFHDPLPPLGPGGEYADVFASVTLQTAPRFIQKFLEPLVLTRLFLDDDCTDLKVPSFTVPAQSPSYVFAGSSSAPRHPKQFTIGHGGTIVYTIGHTHGWVGGKDVTLYKNEEKVRELKTRKSRREYIYETLHGADHLTFNAGDVFSMTATYENPQNAPIPDAMGMIGLYMTR